MKPLARVALGVAVLLSSAALAGCKAVEQGTKAISRTTVAGEDSPNANSVACGSERQEVELAVESFSLRSVKLRHHRGPLYTVPFGELGAVQNMSRDWVIDKTSR